VLLVAVAIEKRTLIEAAGIDIDHDRLPPGTYSWSRFFTGSRAR